MTATEREAERISRETGMGYVQAYRHVKQLDLLRRQRCLRRYNPNLITVTER